MSKLKSLSIFFPFYNDEGTVLKLISEAYILAPEISLDFEVIALHGGKSHDKTFEKILEAKDRYPDLKIINKNDNSEGYAVIKYGFESSTKDWVFYTDGDNQYDLKDLKKLVKVHFDTNSDVINGFKLNRADGFLRLFLGNLYARFSSYIFELPIRDTDCDFRLIRNSYLKKLKLKSKDSSILVELVKKLELEGARFSEVGVGHFKRAYGSSNYSPLKLVIEKVKGDFKLYIIFKNKEYLIPKLRLIKFGMVGTVSVSIQLILFNLFLIFGANPVISVFLADQFAILNSFYLNNKFTFKDRKFTFSRNIFKPFIKFYSIVSITTLIQASIVYLGILAFGNTVLISNILFISGLFLAFVINYNFQKRFVWSY